eukprot:NODE_18589_length_885_cov_7.058047.p2 GENE.NODE_18589_length_885_cov_7.058047~~NODE_18589_length_885_cov_7.058047.p2  ORF type:complete len:144 (+),score=38.86 NODE_18589_length_885_cov_7.058047:142-573(+)
MVEPASAPQPAAAAYSINTPVEVWSDSQNAWLKGKVTEVRAETICVTSALLANGQRLSKEVEYNSPLIRIAAGGDDTAEEEYQVGRLVELWSNSRQKWLRATIVQRRGDVVQVTSEWLPDGTNVSKELPVNDAELRLISAPPA